MRTSVLTETALYVISQNELSIRDLNWQMASIYARCRGHISHHRNHKLADLSEMIDSLQKMNDAIREFVKLKANPGL